MSAKAKKSDSKQVKRKPKTQSPTGVRQSAKQKKYAALEALKGLDASIWKEDAQEYVNKLRGNDR